MPGTVTFTLVPQVVILIPLRTKPESQLLGAAGCIQGPMWPSLCSSVWLSLLIHLPSAWDVMFPWSTSRLFLSLPSPRPPADSSLRDFYSLVSPFRGSLLEAVHAGNPTSIDRVLLTMASCPFPYLPPTS